MAESDSTNNLPHPVKIVLILAADPKRMSRLRLDEEIREIEEVLRRSKHRNRFNIHAKLAINDKDIRRAMLDYEPQIVHFIGHGQEDGIFVEGEMGFPALISTKVLANLFELFSNSLECVILSACYSASQANAIKKHIKYVIGMKNEIKDKAAIEFAVGFYDALGAGKSVEDAFKFGCNAIQQIFPDLPEHLIPVLKKRKGIEKDIKKKPGKPGHLDHTSTLPSKSGEDFSPPKFIGNPRKKRLLSIILGLSIIFIAIAILTDAPAKIKGLFKRPPPTSSKVEPKPAKIIIKGRNISKEETLEISKEIMKIIKKFKHSDIKWEISLKTRAPQIEGKIFLLYPYQKIRLKNIRFSWSAPKGVKKCQLSIYDSESTKIWERKTTGNFLQLENPSVLFESGATYFWEVRSLPAGLAASKKSYFQVLSSAQEHDLSAHLQNIPVLEKTGSLIIPPQLTQAFILLHFQMLEESKEVVEKYLNDYPEDVRARKLILYIYKKMGWYWKLKNES